MNSSEEDISTKQRKEIKKKSKKNKDRRDESANDVSRQVGSENHSE
jgi:hypothetical protein